MKSLYGKICGLLFAGFFVVSSYPAIGSSPTQTFSETQGTAEKKDDGLSGYSQSATASRKMLWNNIFTNSSMRQG